MSRRFYSFSFILFLFFISLPIFVSAVQVVVPGSVDVQKTTIPEFIANLYNFALYFGGALAVLMIIAGAVYYTFSATTPSQKGKGMDIIWGALWGLGLLLGAYLILKTTNSELVLLRGPGGEIAKDVSFDTSTQPTQENTTSKTPVGSIPVVTTGQDGQLTFNFAEDQTKKEDKIPFFIKNFYSFSLYLAGGAAIIMLVVGGIYYLVSATSPSGKGQGKEIFIGAALGLLLIVGSYLILKTVNPELVNLQNPGGDLAKNVGYDDCKAPETNGTSTAGIIISSKLEFCKLDEYPRDPKTGACKCYITKQWETAFYQESPDMGTGGDVVDCKNPQKLTGKNAAEEIVKKANWFYENFGKKMCYTQGKERNMCETSVVRPPTNCNQGEGEYKGASDCTGFASYIYRCVMGIKKGFNTEAICAFDKKTTGYPFETADDVLEYYGQKDRKVLNQNVKSEILTKIQPGDIIAFAGSKHKQAAYPCRSGGSGSGHAMIVTKVISRDTNDPQIEIIDQGGSGVKKRIIGLGNGKSNLDYVLKCGVLTHIKGND